MLRSFGIATSITTAVFWCLSTTTISGWLGITNLLIQMWNSHMILAWLLFPTTFGGMCHLDSVTYSSYLVQMCYDMLHHLCSFFAQPASEVLSDVVGASLDSLFRACCCAAMISAMISASLLSFSPAFSSHCYVFSMSATSSIYW